MFDICTRQSGDLEIIVVEGEIDMSVAPRVRMYLLQAWKKGRRAVAVDLSSVPYMDSAGIATLIEGLQWSRKEGARFLLIGARENVAETLKLAKLHGLFDSYSTEEEAVTSLSRIAFVPTPGKG